MAEVSDVTRSTLDLLERMGVVVPVSVADPNTGEPVTFYRLVTERDGWPVDSRKTDSEEKST